MAPARSSRMPPGSRAFNAWVMRLAASPRWRWLVPGGLTAITYKGRRSGRTVRLPVSARRVAPDRLTIGVALPQRKQWWRNFTGDGGPIQMRVDGVERAGYAVAQADARGRVGVTVFLEDPA